MHRSTDGVRYRVHNLIIKNIYMYISIMENLMEFYLLDTFFFFLFNRYFQASEFFFLYIYF